MLKNSKSVKNLHKFKGKVVDKRPHRETREKNEQKIKAMVLEFAQKISKKFKIKSKLKPRKRTKGKGKRKLKFPLKNVRILSAKS